MASNLDFEGVYDKNKRFMFNNWSEEDFIQHFGAESAYNDNRVIETNPAFDLTIKAGEMRELGHFQALMCTRHFVNREMMRDAMKLTGKERERGEMGMNNAALRDPYEKKTLAEIVSGQETPFMDTLRAKIRAEEVAKIQAEQPQAMTTFNEEDVIPKKKMGRPAKVETFE